MSLIKPMNLIESYIRYCDADYAGDSDTSIGYCVFIGGNLIS